MAPEESEFSDESFDLSEIESSVEGGPIFLHNGTKLLDHAQVSAVCLLFVWSPFHVFAHRI
jgi:hypothetical protein